MVAHPHLAITLFGLLIILGGSASSFYLHIILITLDSLLARTKI